MYILCNAKRLCKVVKKYHEAYFEYADFGILITHRTAKPGISECALHKSSDGDEFTIYEEWYIPFNSDHNLSWSVNLAWPDTALNTVTVFNAVFLSNKPYFTPHDIVVINSDNLIIWQR